MGTRLIRVWNHYILETNNLIDWKTWFPWYTKHDFEISYVAFARNNFTGDIFLGHNYRKSLNL